MPKRAPLKHRDAVKALKHLGFYQAKNKSGSHEQWKKDFPGQTPSFRKVTLDKHHQPYHRELLKSIASQAGVSVKELYHAAGLDY